VLALNSNRSLEAEWWKADQNSIIAQDGNFLQI
jgi:hypothetical protein